MKDEELLNTLEEAAERLSIKLDYDEVRKGEVTSYGDAFVLRGEKHILIDKRLDSGEKADLLIDILARFDTSDIHLAPEVRERLERAVERWQEAEEKAEKEAAEGASKEEGTEAPKAKAEEETD